MNLFTQLPYSFMLETKFSPFSIQLVRHFFVDFASYSVVICIYYDFVFLCLCIYQETTNAVRDEYVHVECILFRSMNLRAKNHTHNHFPWAIVVLAKFSLSTFRFYAMFSIFYSCFVLLKSNLCDK